MQATSVSAVTRGQSVCALFSHKINNGKVQIKRRYGMSAQTLDKTQPRKKSTKTIANSCIFTVNEQCTFQMTEHTWRTYHNYYMLHVCTGRQINKQLQAVSPVSNKKLWGWKRLRAQTKNRGRRRGSRHCIALTSLLTWWGLAGAPPGGPLHPLLGL